MISVRSRSCHPHARLRAPALALGLALLVAGCSGEDPGDPGAGGSTPASPTAEAEEADAPLTGPGVTTRPPRGDLRLLASYAGPETFDVDGRIAFTDDAVVSVGGGYRVQALDRAGGEVRWTARVRDPDPGGSGRGGGEQVCPTPSPPPGATAVVVVTGTACGVLTSFDLATGEPTGRVVADYLTFGPVTRGFAQVGEWTYWADADGTVRRIEADGTSSEVLDADDLGITEGTDRLQQVFADATGDVLVVKTDDGAASALDAGVIRGTNPTETGELIGVGLEATSGSSRPEVLWRVETAQAVGDVVPGSTSVGSTRDPLGGPVLTALAGGSDSAAAQVRLAPLDPEDGTLGTGYVQAARAGAGQPAWARDLGGVPVPGRATVTVGDAVLSTVVAADGAEDSVALYDVEAGERAWVWRPAPRLFSVGPGLSEQSTARPVGLAEDGAFAYVTASSQNGAVVLVELDAATGEQTGLWRVPRSVSDRMSTVEMYLSSDRLVVLDPQYLAGPRTIRLALFEIG